MGPGERVPPDALYILQSIRVFGHFEKPVFLKLCKHTEIMNLAAGAALFKIGDPDENVFIVQQGLVSVYITGSDGSQIALKLVKTGESVTSLLSFTDVLTGHTSTYKTVSAKAVEDSVVVKLPMQAFQEVFQDHPDAFIRVIQVIMVRLQRVTFTALHQYLGLSAELVNQGTHKKKQSPFSGSPVRSKTRENFGNQGADGMSASFPGISDAHEVPETPQSVNVASGSQPVPITTNRKYVEIDFLFYSIFEEFDKCNCIGILSFPDRKPVSIGNCPSLVPISDRILRTWFQSLILIGQAVIQPILSSPVTIV